MDIDSWLRESLIEGPMDTEVISNFARMEGFSRGRLKEARRRLGVVTRQYAEVDGTTRWEWSLPEVADERIND